MIEKKLTLAVIRAVILESSGVLIWAGAASARLKEMEVRVAAQAGLSDRLARVEVRLELAAAQLERIADRLEGL
jgi:hypothetical protein